MLFFPHVYYRHHGMPTLAGEGDAEGGDARVITLQ